MQLPSDLPAAEAALARTAQKIEGVIDAAPVLDRIPGRSVSLAGLGVMAGAVALSVLPGFSGVGLVWSAVMLAGGAVVAAGELRAAGRPVPFQVPPALRHPLVAPGFAALVALHAFQLLAMAIVPLLWLAAALLLGWDQARKTRLSPDGFGRHFDLRQTARGYRGNVLAGVGLCLASLFFTWGRSSGYWSGGYSYNLHSGYDYNGNYGYGYTYDYTPMQNYWPGWELSGRNQSFALFAEALLLALVLWAALRPEGQGGRGFRSFAPAACAVLGAWWLFNASSGAGVWLFAAGLAFAAFGAFRILRGEDEGAHDLAHLVARVRKR